MHPRLASQESKRSMSLCLTYGSFPKKMPGPLDVPNSHCLVVSRALSGHPCLFEKCSVSLRISHDKECPTCCHCCHIHRHSAAYRRGSKRSKNFWQRRGHGRKKPGRKHTVKSRNGLLRLRPAARRLRKSWTINRRRWRRVSGRCCAETRSEQPSRLRSSASWCAAPHHQISICTQHFSRVTYPACKESCTAVAVQEFI
jgi:hypothetical protein